MQLNFLGLIVLALGVVLLGLGISGNYATFWQSLSQSAKAGRMGAPKSGRNGE